MVRLSETAAALAAIAIVCAACSSGDDPATDSPTAIEVATDDPGQGSGASADTGSRTVASISGSAGTASTTPPELSAPIPDGAEVERIADDFRLAEGCVWRDARLLVSDVIAETVYALESGGRQVVQQPSGYANGHVVDGAGRLLQAEHGNRRLVALDEAGTEVLADSYRGARLNSPNDVTVAGDGSIWFTDPTFGLNPPYGPGGQRAELDFAGVYRIAAAGEEPELITAELSQPNGIALSQDGSTAFITDTATNRLMAMDVATRELREIASGVDGVAVDIAGRVWTTVASGVAVTDMGGNEIVTIDVPDQPTNLCWGGEDGRTLYVTTYSGVYSIATNTTGVENRGVSL